MKVSDQIVMNPRGLAATTFVSAAGRAGARGILNTSGYSSLAAIQAETEAIADATDRPIGLRLTADSAKWITELTSLLTSQWQWAIVSDARWPDWRRWVDGLRRLGIEILVEVCSKQDFGHVARLEADGVILKGSESGGRIGDSSALMLIQQWKKFATSGRQAELPFWVQGGVGPNTAAGCFVMGAVGVVLDNQLALCRESPIGGDTRRAIAALDGSETRVIGEQLGDLWRICPPRGSDLVNQLTSAEEELIATKAAFRNSRWKDLIDQAAEQSGWPLFFAGQEIALASSLADQFVTVSGVVQAVCERAVENIQLADALQPIAPGAPLAASHNTKFPLLQGPMTRVSDTAGFAAAVATNGGLPFLALALMRGADVDQLLTDTGKVIGDRPWGVGLLGFLPPEIRREQTEVILRHKPPFAIIAGGRPDQAREFDELGIPTYLHVPSPGLLRRFLKDGARRFIFEGRECGGHVGPRSSFLLWETMLDVLLEHIGNGRGNDLHLVFAGGIHDAESAAAVATLSASLSERGARIGILMGTAYLFTTEAVANGAIVDRFQSEAIKAGSTVLFETGPGHAVRCLKTPYYDDFVAEKKRLRKAGKTHDEVVKSLEMMNIGRLRVASKGVDRVAAETGVPRKLAPIDDQEQFQRGMYMIGQVASLRDETTTIANLHSDVTSSATDLIHERARRLRANDSASDSADTADSCDIAIVGMACYYPGASSLTQYWENTLRLQYEVTEVPGTHWDWRLFYDPDPRARDKIISKWGGFLGDVPFDPLRYGITPKSVMSIEPLQLLLLECVREAVNDAGYARRPFNRERTAAVLGIGGGGSPMAVAYGFRSCLPLLDNLKTLPLKSHEIMQQCDEFLPEWTEDSFPGFLLNVAVGRIANRFDFGGSNYAIDAACASSLAAVHACIRELEQGTADVAVAMGADTVQTPYAFMAFSKTHALSAEGRCRPFDANADGIVLSEGIGAVVLKRLKDAERDGDTIYSVIRGVGASSDGRDKGLTAPNAAGQLRALQRAYAKAGISPKRLGLIEAHGTGTVVGDRTEASALAQILSESGASPQSCALGSVKSLIGHSKCAAGIAGLIKTAKALHHKVLPPTLVETPNPQIAREESPLYLNTTARPWVQASNSPRCAGVSAFGFGGTNVHMVLEEYPRNLGDAHRAPSRQDWPTEIFVWRGERSNLLEELTVQINSLQDAARPRLAEYAASLWRQAAAQSSDRDVATLAIIATDQSELIDRMQKGRDVVAGHKADYASPRGIYFTATSDSLGKVAFLFPGQGAQYPNMAADTAMSFTTVREALDLFTLELQEQLDTPLGRLIYPPSPFEPQQEKNAAETLAQTSVAQPAIGAVSLGLLRLLRQLGVEADVVAGHSYGEFVALHAAGVFDERELARLSHVRGELMRAAADKNPGAMAAVAASRQTVERLVGNLAGVTIANLNAPEQTVISATTESLDVAIEKLQADGINATRLDVACAFHSPAVSAACQPMAGQMQDLEFHTPKIPVYSNTTGAAHALDVKEIKRTLAAHIAMPVRFLDEIESMYADGVRVFVEVGPQRHISGLVRRILSDRPHVLAATDVKDRSGVTQIQHCVGQLLCAGVHVDLTPLFERRVSRTFDLRRLAAETGKVEYPRNTWMVNGIRSRLWNAPEPKLLGQRWDGNGEPDTKNVTIASAAIPETAASTDPEQQRSTPTREPAPATVRPTSATVVASSHVAAVKPADRPDAKSSETSTMNNGQIHDKPDSQPGSFDELPADVDAVMLGFQDLMAKFLDTQQSVMHQYLTGAPLEGPAAPSHMPQSADRFVQMPPPPSSPASEVVAADSDAGLVPDQRSRFGDVSVDRVSAADSEVLAGGVSANENGSDGDRAASSASAETADGSALRMSMDEISAKLVELVSERTGYPEDMLDPDLDLEADLGIDSIKRVEILGDLADALGIVEEEDDSTIEFEKLTTIRTLQGILDYLQAALSTESSTASEDGHQTSPPASPESSSSGNGQFQVPSTSSGPPSAGTVDAAPQNGDRHAPAASTNGGASDVHAGIEAPDDVTSTDNRTVKVQRGLIELVRCPITARGGMPIPSGAIVITDDRRGIAVQLAERFADFGQEVVLLRMSDSSPMARDRTYEGDLTSETVVEQILAQVKSDVGDIAGFVHLMPLAAIGDMDWLTRAEEDVKSFYLLSRRLENELTAAATKGLAFVLAPISLGGGLGFSDLTEVQRYLPGQGGVVGFAKCLAQEATEVLVRAVDFAADAEPNDICESLLSELTEEGGPVEVGYHGGQRVTWQPISGEFKDPKNKLSLDSDSVILLTGGARGITAAIGIEIARRYQCQLVLVGRSSVPGSEDGETVQLESPAEIKAALIARRKASGDAIQPAEVEAEFRSIMRDREIRATISAIKAAGSKVTYDSLDVRDEKAFAKLVHEIRKRYGRLDGVIHGAGVIEDKLIRDKTPESFDRVFGAKVRSAWNISQHVAGNDLRFCIFFASVASRYGNKGQADYAAANEVLTKLAADLDRRWDARVFAIDWGPWAEIGMVSDLEKHLTARGVTLISPAEGADHLLRELEFGAKGETEIIIAGGAERLAIPQKPAEANA